MMCCIDVFRIYLRTYSVRTNCKEIIKHNLLMFKLQIVCELLPLKELSKRKICIFHLKINILFMLACAVILNFCFKSEVIAFIFFLAQNQKSLEKYVKIISESKTT